MGTYGCRLSHSGMTACLLSHVRPLSAFLVCLFIPCLRAHSCFQVKNKELTELAESLSSKVDHQVDANKKVGPPVLCV